MKSTLEKQLEAIATINVAQAAMNSLSRIIDFLNTPPPSSFSAQFGFTPMSFLIGILRMLNVPVESLLDFTANFLVKFLPYLETAVKVAILTRLKQYISCTLDPRIPKPAREDGILIDIKSIDLFDKLSHNPLSKDGSTHYFGTSGIKDVYKLVRAEDMDAFLWYVMHHSHLPMSRNISDLDTFTYDGRTYGGAAVRNVSDTSLPKSALGSILVQWTNSTMSRIMLGNTFTYKNGYTISMCIHNRYDKNNAVIENTIVPITAAFLSNGVITPSSGYTWHSPKVTINKLIGNMTKEEKSGYDDYDLFSSRNYDDEIALCNIEYVGNVAESSPDASIIGTTTDKIRVRILPQPFMHVPNLTTDPKEPPTRFRKVLFNKNGEYDKKGNYTILDPINDWKSKMVYDCFEIDAQTGNVKVTDKEKIIAKSVECYRGMSVAEFNYDFIMGMKLFDAKQIVSSLFDALCNTSVGGGVSYSRNDDLREQIRQIVKNIIDYTGESSDCYFTFSNEKYEKYLRLAEEKRSNRQPFGDVSQQSPDMSKAFDILAEYDANAEMQTQIDIIKKSLTSASVAMSENSDDVDKNKVEWDFHCDIVENLIYALYTSILTPKLFLILELNEQMMGKSSSYGSISKIAKDLLQTIVDVAVDLVAAYVRALFDFVMAQLAQILAALAAMELKEYADMVSTVMSNLKNCLFLFQSLFSQQDLQTQLDNIDYADIDERDMPTNQNNC